MPRTVFVGVVLTVAVAAGATPGLVAGPARDPVDVNSVVITFDDYSQFDARRVKIEIRGTRVTYSYTNWKAGKEPKGDRRIRERINKDDLVTITRQGTADSEAVRELVTYLSDKDIWNLELNPTDRAEPNDQFFKPTIVTSVAITVAKKSTVISRDHTSTYQDASLTQFGHACERIRKFADRETREAPPHGGANQ